MNGRVRQRLIGAVLMAPLAFTAVANLVGAEAQEASAFGGFTLDSRATGIGVIYDLPGSLPLGTLVDVGSPDAQTRLATGPFGTALAGIGYPGPVILGGEALLVQAGLESPVDIPDYPFVVQANTSGPTEVRDDQTVPGSVMEATAEGVATQAIASLPGSDADPVLRVGSLEALSTSQVSAAAETTTVAVARGIELLGGLIAIESVVTDLGASSDATTGTSRGHTTIAGATVLGEPVTIGPEGIEFDDPPDAAPGPLSGVFGGLGITDPLSDGLVDVLSQVGSLNEIFNQAGITIRLAEPRATSDGPSAERVSEGLVIEFEQELSSTPLADLLALIPLLPELPGSPVGPNDLIQIIQSRQISSISIGRASVSATASPAFELPPFEVDIATPTPTPAAPSGGSTGATPSAAPGAVPSTGPGATTGGGTAATPIATGNPLALRGVLGPGMVFAAMLGGFVLSLGTRKLPDWALDGPAVAGTSCDLLPDQPEGDRS